MRPDNVHSVLFVGLDTVHKSSFLFQCAVHWAEQGTKVDYISARPINTLPPPIHGIDASEPSSLKNIRFMYLPKRQDLLHHLYTLHEHTHVSEVIMVDGLEYYCGHEERPLEEKHESEMNAALVCASLIDGTSVAARRVGKTALLVVHFQSDYHIPNKLQHLELFFSDTIWFIESGKGDRNKEIVLTTAAPELGHSQKTKIVFEPRSWDGALVLKKIAHLIKT